LCLLELVLEQVLSNLHLQLLLHHLITELISIFLGHPNVATPYAHLDGLIDEPKDCVDNDLSLPHFPAVSARAPTPASSATAAGFVSWLTPRMCGSFDQSEARTLSFLFLLALVEGIGNFEVYGRPVLLGDLLLPQVGQELVRLVPLGVKIQSQVVHSLISGSAIVYAVLDHKVLGIVQDTGGGVGDVYEAGHQFSTSMSLKFEIASMVGSGRYLRKTEAYLSLNWLLFAFSEILSNFWRAHV
jgi:hypothetical protein